MTFELRRDGLIRLCAFPTRALGWAVPLWATLCGAIASDGFSLTLTDGVRLLLTFLLLEAGWGTLWAALATTDWAAALRRWPDRPAGRTRFLPYTQPASPAGRLARWLAQLRFWWASADGSFRRALAAVIASLCCSLLLAAVLGLSLFLLTALAMSLMELALVLDRGRGQVGAGWDAVLRLGLPWLAGHLAFAAPALPTVALATTFSLAVAGIDRSDRSGGRALWTGGQGIAALFLVLLQRPLAVPFLTLLLLPQLLLAGWDKEGRWPAHAWPWLAAAMLLAAWAL